MALKKVWAAGAEMGWLDKNVGWPRGRLSQWGSKTETWVMHKQEAAG